MQIEIIVATRAPAEVYWLECKAGESLSAIIARLQTAPHSVQLDPDKSILTIHGQQVAPDARVVEGDRIEILSPLVMDPKEARRQRAHSDRNQRLKNPHSTTSSSSS